MTNRLRTSLLAGVFALALPLGGQFQVQPSASVNGTAITPTTVATDSVTLDRANLDVVLARLAARTMSLGPTTGVTLRWATSGLLEVRNFANSAAGDLSAGNGTFGTSEATVVASPVLGVYNTGDSWIVSRNTTNNIEGFFGAYSSGVFFGSATNTILYIGVNNDAKWGVQTAGHLTAVADNTYDIGASGATRPRNVYIAGQGSFGGVVSALNFEQSTGSGAFYWAGRSEMYSPATGQLRFNNSAGNAGIGLDFTTDGTVKIRNRALSAYGTIDVLGISASGVAGCTGTPTAATNGIATTCSEPNTIEYLLAEVAALRNELAALKAGVR